MGGSPGPGLGASTSQRHTSTQALHGAEVGIELDGPLGRERVVGEVGVGHGSALRLRAAAGTDSSPRRQVAAAVRRVVVGVATRSMAPAASSPRGGRLS